MVPSGAALPRRRASPMFPMPGRSHRTVIREQGNAHDFTVPLSPRSASAPQSSSIFRRLAAPSNPPREREGVRTPPPPRAASFLAGATGFPSSPLGGSSFPAIAPYGYKNDIKDKSNVSKCKVPKEEGRKRGTKKNGKSLSQDQGRKEKW